MEIWQLVLLGSVGLVICCCFGCLPALISIARCGCVYWPPQRSQEALEKLQSSPEFISLLTPHGKCAAYFIPDLEHSSAECEIITIMYSHASAEDLVSLRYTLRRLRAEIRTPFNFLAYDYPGYTWSEARKGRCCWRFSEEAVNSFAAAALDWLMRTRNIPSHKIVIYGRSIGSGPATQLVADRADLRFAGLVLESGLSSIIGVKCCFLAKLPWLACIDMFQNSAKIQRVGCPTLFLNGTEDGVTSIQSNAELLAGAATNAAWVSRVWVHGAGHNDLKMSGQDWGNEFFEGLDQFLEKISQNDKNTPEPLAMEIASNPMSSEADAAGCGFSRTCKVHPSTEADLDDLPNETGPKRSYAVFKLPPIQSSALS